MGFAVLNFFRVESLVALWPLFLIYAGVILLLAARWAFLRTRPVALALATLFGLALGGLLGRMTVDEPTVRVAHDKPWAFAVAAAADRVDRKKEALAAYIDEHLPNIPDLLHANCREIQDALATRGLLCVDVGGDSGRTGVDDHTNPAAVSLWRSYRSAKADLDRLMTQTN